MYMYLHVYIYIHIIYITYKYTILPKVLGKGLTTLVISMSTNLNVKAYDLYIHYTDKSIGTPPSLEQKNALPNLWQQRWEHNSCI